MTNETHFDKARYDEWISNAVAHPQQPSLRHTRRRMYAGSALVACLALVMFNMPVTNDDSTELYGDMEYVNDYMAYQMLDGDI